VAAARSALSCPIIGLVKRDLASSPVRITPLIEDVMGLAKAGADIIACDTTDRGRPVAAHALLAAIKHAGKLAMADTSGMTEAGAAVDMGFDLIGTTMSGYTGGPEPDEPDFAFVAAAAKLARPLIAEGRFRTPEQAAKAISLGAHAVVAGSAITRPEHITSWFAAAIAKASLA
jgi:N-acetylmannosamine-6-phosphate 2-epimerase/N-acetylmannosamine kinase